MSQECSLTFAPIENCAPANLDGFTHFNLISDHNGIRAMGHGVANPPCEDHGAAWRALLELSLGCKRISAVAEIGL